jgi:hypothetical protein
MTCAQHSGTTMAPKPVLRSCRQHGRPGRGPCRSIWKARSAMAFVVVLILAITGRNDVVAVPPQTFELRDYLGHEWTNELVSFAIPDTVVGESTAYRLESEDGRIVPHQFAVDLEGRRTVRFLVDLPQYGRARYHLRASKAGQSPPAGVRVEQERGLIRLSNALTGIEIPTAEGDGDNGPFLRMRLRSGAWIGASRLSSTPPIVRYEARVIAEGPVYGEIECRYEFAEGKRWGVNYRVIAGEPVVLIDEHCDLGGGATWELEIGRGFEPTHSFASVAYGNKEQANYSIQPVRHDGNTIFSLAAWPLWWEPTSVAFCGLFRRPSETANLADRGTEDFLAAAAGRGEVWAHPGDDGQRKGIPLVAMQNGPATFSLPLAGPGRHWLLAALTVADNLVAPTQLSAAQRLMVKHCETGLDEVKDMVLEWDSGHPRDYPRLVTTREELAARPEIVATPPQADAATETPGPQVRKLLDPALRIFLGSVDQPAQSVDTVHRCERIQHIVAVADMLLGRDVLTTAEIKKVLAIHAVQWGRPVLTINDTFSATDVTYARAQLAFLAYKLSSPNYYSPERNFRANPNMTTMRSCTEAIVAAAISDHPNAATWAESGSREINRELDEWTMPGGGWLESPHYQTTAMSGMLFASFALRNAGFKDYLDDARLHGAMRYLARISTPPDPRFGNQRHFPPAGNTYQFETTGLFGIFAKLCRQSRPAFADEMQWVWQQQGAPSEGMPVTFHDAALFPEVDHAVPQPLWGSEHFRGSGVVLRNGFGGDRETYMWLLQGRFAEHYDHDGGSFELWGKGRPLCLDWGYHGRMPAWQHNRVDVGGRGEISAFQPFASVDYLRSRQAGWERQVMLVKDVDYIVMCDSIAQGKGSWWLWLYTAEPLRLSNGVLKMRGQHDVDLDIWLSPKLLRHLTPITSSGEDEVSGESTTDVRTTRQSIPCFNASTRKQGSLTQEGLRIQVADDEPVFCLLYPRLRDDPSAVYTPLAEGRGVKIQHGAGTDYVFLAGQPFEFQDNDVSFKGTAGLIRVRDAASDATLSEPGMIGLGEETLSSAEPAFSSVGAQ